MSIYPSPDKLDAQESKFALVIMAAKRARQIKDGARRLIETRAPNPLTVALEEIAEGQLLPRTVEDASITAYKDALKPNVPSLEDIIGAGPVLPTDIDIESGPSQLAAALRNAEPGLEDDDLVDTDDEEELTPVDEYGLGTTDINDDLDDDDRLGNGMDEEED